MAPEVVGASPTGHPTLRWSSGQDAWFSARRSPVRTRHGVRIARVKLMRTSVWLPTRRQPVRGRSPVPRCAVGCRHPALTLDQGHAGSSPARTAHQEGQAESWRRQPFRKRSRSDPLSVRPRHPPPTARTSTGQRAGLRIRTLEVQVLPSGPNFSPEWRNGKPRLIQVQVSARTCGFDSRLRYPTNKHRQSPFGRRDLRCTPT